MAPAAKVGSWDRGESRGGGGAHRDGPWLRGYKAGRRSVLGKKRGDTGDEEGEGQKGGDHMHLGSEGNAPEWSVGAGMN